MAHTRVKDELQAMQETNGSYHQIQQNIIEIQSIGEKLLKQIAELQGTQDRTRPKYFVHA